MAMKPELLFGKVFHSRLIPVKNTFQYGIYYLVLPLSQINSLNNSPIRLNRWGLMSFYPGDHIPKDSVDLEQWKNQTLARFGINKANGETLLVSMPRIFGYIFNPVSFWLCLDNAHQLRAVICAVNNTYGEKHDYICVHPDQRVIIPGDKLTAQKVFHVSPFIEREGSYQFSFNVNRDSMSFAINYFNIKGDCLLTTSLSGKLKAITTKQMISAHCRYPLVTLMVIYRIHWQALILFLKRIKFINKPKQIIETVTRSF